MSLTTSKSDKNKRSKAYILTIGSVILCGAYIVFLILSTNLGFGSQKINGIATLVFAILYFGLFITVKTVKKGFYRANNMIISNLCLFMSSFVIAILVYTFSKNFLITLVVFMVCQVMYTIYFKNFVPVPGYQKAFKLYRMGNYKAAKNLLTQISNNYPKNTDSLILLGNIYFNEMNYDKALEVFRKSLEIDPEDPVIHKSLASVYTATEDFNKSKEHSIKVIQLTEADWNAYYNIALCNLFNEDFENAIDYFKKALEFEMPSRQIFLVHYGLAKSLKAVNENDTAKSEYDNSIKQTSDDTLKYWNTQLKHIKNNSNKPSQFVKEAIEYVSTNKEPLNKS